MKAFLAMEDGLNILSNGGRAERLSGSRPQCVIARDGLVYCGTVDAGLQRSTDGASGPGWTASRAGKA